MQARMTNPAVLIPDAMKALHAFGASAETGDVPAATLCLVHLRVSQINGCSVCTNLQSHTLKRFGVEETEERLLTVAAWRDAPYFTDAERAALALSEAVTRLSDRADSVPDGVWEEATRHYDEIQLAALTIFISAVTVWNRLNVTTRQVAGEWTP